MSLGNERSPLQARMQGVRVARDGSAGTQGKPQVVTNVVKGECVFVGFNDERGDPKVALYFKVGDQYLAPADTVQWCANLRPATDWIVQGLSEKVKDEEPIEVPKTDAVDVLGGEEES